MKKTVKTFKFKKELYEVIEHDSITLINENPEKWYSIKTPENCFGYNDYIHLYKNDLGYYVLPLYRKHTKTLLNKSHKELMKAYGYYEN